MDSPVRLRDLVATSEAVRATPARLEKRAHLVAFLRGCSAAEARLAACWLSGEIPQGAVQVGWRALEDAARPPAQPSLFDAPVAPPAAGTSPALAEVDAVFEELQQAAGAGAATQRTRILRGLLTRLAPEEVAFVHGLLMGELRQGALRALMVEAVADACGLEVEPLRRAIMLAGSFDAVVTAVTRGGAAALEAFQLQPFVPIEPMLAASADDLATALADMGEAAVEWKLDGVRVQLHRDGDDVRLFSRQLRDVTAQAPEIAALGRTLAARRCILDGEIVSRDAAGRPLPFQDLMSAFAHEDAAAGRPRLEAFFFDVLLEGDTVLVDAPYRERRAALERIVPAAHRVAQAIAADAGDAQRVFEAALAAGHEGVMLKALDAPYVAGRRGAAWRKLKPARTADLVILAAEWGHGRRRGRLSNLHLGARVPDDDAGAGRGAAYAPRFAMLGKTFKGLTDAMLVEMTADLQRLETSRDAHTVYVRPERVVEIAYDAVQRSRRYDSGWALRFARVVRFRPDKSPHEATTLAEIRAGGAREVG